MKQTVEDAAKKYAIENIPAAPETKRTTMMAAFKAGVEWQAKQSPWIKLEEPHDPIPNDAVILVRLEDGTIMRNDEDWDKLYMMVTHVMIVPKVSEGGTV